MSNPISIGNTAIVAVNRNVNRNNVRFQNVGTTTLYFARQLHRHTPVVPSATNYEFSLVPGTGAEVNEAYIQTNSTSQINVVSSAATGGSLAIFETNFS